MNRAVVAALFLAACTPTPVAHVRVKAPCVIPSPPSDATLAAAPGLIGRDALLKAYVREVEAAKRACH